MTNFIWPDDLTSIPPEQYRLHLIQIRERRTKIGDKIERLRRITGKLTAGLVRDKVERELLKYKKLLNKADDLISEAEHRLNTVIGLTLQLDDADRPPVAVGE